jgi:hypothetical protein
MGTGASRRLESVPIGACGVCPQGWGSCLSPFQATGDRHFADTSRGQPHPVPGRVPGISCRHSLRDGLQDANSAVGGGRTAALDFNEGARFTARIARNFLDTLLACSREDPGQSLGCCPLFFFLICSARHPAH